MTKFINYQIIRSVGLHLTFIFLLLLLIILEINNVKHVSLLFLWLFTIIGIFEIYSYRKFKNDKEKTSHDIIIDNDTIMHKIEKLEVNYIHLEKGQEDLKKQIAKGQEEIISQNIEILKKLTIK